jgi:hypothetical protein
MDWQRLERAGAQLLLQLAQERLRAPPGGDVAGRQPVNARQQNAAQNDQICALQLETINRPWLRRSADQARRGAHTAVTFSEQIDYLREPVMAARWQI